jgi:hypothetical protein
VSGTGSTVLPAPKATLSPSQLAMLAKLGEERTAKVGDALYRVGDRRAGFIAIVEGEVRVGIGCGVETRYCLVIA